MRWPCVLWRPKILSVTKPRNESSKYAEREPRVLHFLFTESAVYLPINAPKIGMSGKVNTAINPESGSKTNNVAITTNGVIDAKKS